MTDFIHIEPAREHRPAFAAWGLSLDKPLQTASATGWDVPLDLYPSVPTELLDGAYVDGYRFTYTAAPVVEPTAEPKKQTGRKPRKRAASRKPEGAYTRKPSELTEVGGLVMPAALAEQLEADLAAEDLTLDDLTQSVFQPSGSDS